MLYKNVACLNAERSKASKALLKPTLIWLSRKKNALLYCFVHTNKPFWLANLSPLWIKSCIMQISLSVILFLYLDFESFLCIMACMTFSFFSFLFAVCKDSWEDLTDVVEQLRDDTEGACHTNIFQLLFPLMIGFWLSYFEPECNMQFSFPVPVAGAFWTCRSGWTRFAARTRCTGCTLRGCWVSAVSLLKKSLWSFHCMYCSCNCINSHFKCVLWRLF